jgi:hypothetical protein
MTWALQALSEADEMREFVAEARRQQKTVVLAHWDVHNGGIDNFKVTGVQVER